MFDRNASPALVEGQYAVPKGSLATVVTHLVCRERMPHPRRPEDLELARDDRPELHSYRDLHALIGRDWLWTSRIMLQDDALTEILLDVDVELWVARMEGQVIGMVETDFRDIADPKISFFGLIKTAMGKGIGPWIMAETLRRMFDQGAASVRLNTCTLDSAGALPFYLACGFVAERREVRLFTDPRAIGVLDQDAAPHVPMT